MTARPASRAPKAKGRGLPFIFPVLATHLLVATIGALSVGGLAFMAQRRTLLDVTHDLQLAVVQQLREAITRRADDHQAALSAAESILSDPDTVPDVRKQRVRELVAEGRLPHLAVRSTEGALDSVFWAGAEKPELPATLPSTLIAEVREAGYAWAPSEQGLVGVRLWKAGDREIGLLSTHLRREALGEEVERFRDRFLNTDGRVEVTAADGSELASAGAEAPLLADRVGSREPAPNEELGAADEVSAAGRWWVRAFIFAPELRCWIGAAQPRAVALAPVYQLRNRVALLAGLVALVAGLIGLLLARSVTQPVTQLAVRMRESALAGFEQQVPERGSLELQALSRGFNEAISLLARRKNELQTETRMRLRLSRYVSAQDLQEVFSSAAGQDRTVGARSHLFVDLVPQDEPGVAGAAPDRLVLFLGELFSLAAEIIERHGGHLDEHLGDTVLGTFVGPSRKTTAAAAFAAAQELLTEARSLAERWTETLAARAPISAGVVTAGAGEGDAADQAGLLQRAAPPYAVLMDGATAHEVGAEGTQPPDGGAGLDPDVREWRAERAS